MLQSWRRVGWSGWVAACLFVVACGTGGGAGSAEPQPRTPVPPPKADTRPKIVVLGDSLTAGLGLVETQSFPAMLQGKIDTEGFQLEVVNAGVSGDTSAGGLRRLDALLQENVYVLIVALGANDGLRGLSVPEMKRNLLQIIETARQKQVVVILAGMEAPPNYGPEYVAAFRLAYRDLAAASQVTFIPFLLDKVAGQPALNQADGIHPTAEGAAIVAGTVWDVLKPILDRIPTS